MVYVHFFSLVSSNLQNKRQLYHIYKLHFIVIVDKCGKRSVPNHLPMKIFTNMNIFYTGLNIQILLYFFKIIDFVICLTNIHFENIDNVT